MPDQMLRGVGFRSGEYTDDTGVIPVTDAPAIEGSTPNSTFESDAFFPQRLITANYFGTLGGERPDLADPHARRSTAPTWARGAHRHPAGVLRHRRPAVLQRQTNGRSRGEPGLARRAAEYRQGDRHLTRRRRDLLARPVTGDPRPASSRCG